MNRMKKRDLTGMNVSQIIARYSPDSVGPKIMDKDLYYKVTLAAAGGTAEVDLFHANAGTLLTTNITENGRIPTGKHQFVDGLAVTLVGSHATEATRLVDVNLVADKGLLEITQDDKVVYRGGPLRKFLTGLALTKIDATNGVSLGDDGMPLANQFLLVGGKAYTAKIRFPGTGSPVTTGDVVATVELLGQEISE